MAKHRTCSAGGAASCALSDAEIKHSPEPDFIVEVVAEAIIPIVDRKASQRGSEHKPTVCLLRARMPGRGRLRTQAPWLSAFARHGADSQPLERSVARLVRLLTAEADVAGFPLKGPLIRATPRCAAMIRTYLTHVYKAE